MRDIRGREKTAGKTAQKTARPGRPFRRGTDPRRGVGKKGRSGRPREEWRGYWRELLDSERGRALLWQRAQKSDSLLIRLIEYAFGKPREEVTVHQPTGTVIAVGGDEQQYIGALRAVRALGEAETAGDEKAYAAALREAQPYMRPA
jgi:hypothetical protein